MAGKNKPYEQFGPYVLFKKLDADALGELWRAGRIDGNQLGPLFALRRFTGGNRDALANAIHAAQQVIPKLTGASFVREQVASVQNETPYLAWDYASGRSLRHIVDRARGGNGTPANPIPIDQAIVIAEKVALSLATMGDLRDSSGSRLAHGGLIPQFIWISDDGEIRVAGQLLGSGLIASLQDPKVASDIGRYFAPEYRHSGTPSKTAEVYSMGAILYLLVSGQEPPDASTASAFMAVVRAAKTMAGAAIPDDIRALIDKSLHLDPASRFATIAEMKQAITALAHGGKYSATTFNLAFYLSNLLKKEMETEVLEREKESKLNLAPYLDAPPQAAAAAPSAPAIAVPMFADAQEQPKSKGPMIAVAAIAVLVLGSLGAWFALGKKTTTAAAAPQVAAAATMQVPAPQKQPVMPEPVLASGSTPVTATTATTATMDEAAQKKAFEDAVKAKLQSEMMKLQSDFTKNLQQQQAKNAPVASAPAPSAPAPAPVQPQQQADNNAPSAAQLDAARREREQAAASAAQPPVQTQTQAPAPAVSQPVQQVAQPQTVAPQVREGDVVEVGDLDTLPRAHSAIRPQYPPIAARQHIEATVVVTALISETGQVMDVRVLKGEPKFGINDAAVRAMKAARFSSPMKDGKRVKTWLPQTFVFKP